MRIGLLVTSFRRKMLNQDLQQAVDPLAGRVIDMGGENRRARGKFRRPSRPDLHWTCVNIDRTRSPEIVADIEHMPFPDGCAHAVICTEVLEHVAQPEATMKEAYRLLKPGGMFIGSMPFLFRVHAAPYDFQRYTASKLIKMLEDTGFEETEVRAQGLYFTVMADMIRDGLNQIKSRFFRWPVASIFWPFLRLSIYLDGRAWVRNSARLSSYTTGYFITACKGDATSADGATH